MKKTRMCLWVLVLLLLVTVSLVAVEAVAASRIRPPDSRVRNRGRGQDQDELDIDYCSVRLRVSIGDQQGGKPAEWNTSVAFHSGDGRRITAAMTDRHGLVVVDLTSGEWRAVKKPTEASPLWGEAVFTVREGELKLEKELILSETRLVEVKGLLLDETTGGPIPNAQVRVARGTEDKVMRAEAKTDEEGRFVLKRLWVHDKCRLVIRSEDVKGDPGHVLTKAELEKGALTWRVPLLPPGPVVNVRLLVEHDGKRVPITSRFLGWGDDAKTESNLVCGRVRMNPKTARPDGIVGKVSGEVSPHGTCRFGRLQPGQYLILTLNAMQLVNPEGQAPSKKRVKYFPASGALTFVVPSPEAQEIDVETVLSQDPTRFSLQGTVADSLSSEPIAGASVEVYGSNGSRERLTTDKAGTFNAQVMPSVYSIVVKRDGYSKERQTTVVVHDAPLTFKLEPYFRVSGTVKLPDGAVPSVAWLSLWQDNDHKVASFEEDGSFASGYVRAGMYTLIVQAEGVPAVVRQVEIKADLEDVQIQFETGTRITGKVTFDEGLDPPKEVILSFVDPETRIIDGWAEVGPEGDYSLAVSGTDHVVYLFLSKDIHELQKVKTAKPATLNFHVTRKTLAEPTSMDELGLKF